MQVTTVECGSQIISRTSRLTAYLSHFIVQGRFDERKRSESNSKRAERPKGEPNMTINLDELRAEEKHQLDAIDELKPLAERLNAESNDLNQVINVISDRLASLNLGIEVWFRSSTSDSDIGFGKFADRGCEGWSLAARRGTLSSPLTSASRDLRIEGLTLVPQIVTRLRTETTERLRQIAEAKQFAGRDL